MYRSFHVNKCYTGKSPTCYGFVADLLATIVTCQDSLSCHYRVCNNSVVSL